jgi:bifunctional DNA-binding transcriptional regulator/antitoxin component of YhaV-PrlF toxin-antitoxin module
MSRVTSKLQVTLPKAIADLHNIRPGTEIQFESALDCIRILIGKARITLSLDEKMRLLEEARSRQQLRNKNFPRPGKPLRRGWNRDDLYRRGATD